MKKLFAFALGLAIVFTACDKGNDDEKTYIVTFEDAQLLQNTGSDGQNKYNNVLWGIELAEDKGGAISYDGILYTEKDAGFYTYWSDNGGLWDSWGGFAIAENYDKTTLGMANQFSAYASNSGKFAVCYCPDPNYPSGATYDTPTIVFKKASKPSSLDMAANTWLYTHIAGTDSSGTSFTVTITGYLGATATGSVDVPLIKNGNIFTDWTKVDLTDLGKVNKISFTSVCNDTWAPSYFCVDNLTFKL